MLAFATADSAYMSGGYELSLPSAPARTLHRQACLASVFEPEPEPEPEPATETETETEPEPEPEP